jgi:hypothetical protein
MTTDFLQILQRLASGIQADYWVTLLLLAWEA